MYLKLKKRGNRMGKLLLIILSLSTMVFLATIYLLRKRKEAKEKGDEVQAIFAYTRAFKELLSPIPDSLQYETFKNEENGRIELRLHYRIGSGFHEVAKKTRTFTISADKQYLYTQNENMVSFMPPFQLIDTNEGIKLNGGAYLLYYAAKNVTPTDLPKHFHEQYCITTAWNNVHGIRAEIMTHLKQLLEDFNGISQYPEYKIEA